MWYNKYVGIPYKDNGRNLEGIDCWGLARLIYKEQYNIDLPSFVTEYSGPDDREFNSELIARNSEAWEQVTLPNEGDIVLFNILGTPSHIGIYLGNNKFIHAKDGNASVIEDISSNRWKNRVVGFYKYLNKISVTSVPHPFKTEKFVDYVPDGTTVAELNKLIAEKHTISGELDYDLHIFVNGILVPKQEWATTVLTLKDSIEFRAAVKGDDPTRTILMLAVTFAAPQLAGVWAPVATYGAAVNAAVTFGLMVVGTALVDAIAPIRMPEQNNPGAANGLNMFTGGSNKPNQYGPIPVPLGRIRYTPPLGAQPIIDSPEDTSYLRTMVVWGFGPMEVEDSSLQIGATPLREFKDNNGYEPQRITLDARQPATYQAASNTPEEINRFNAIYSKDTAQQVPQRELTNSYGLGINGIALYGDGKEITSNTEFTVQSGNVSDGTGLQLYLNKDTGNFYLRQISNTHADEVTFTLHANHPQYGTSIDYKVTRCKPGSPVKAIIRSNSDVVITDGQNFNLPIANEMLVYGNGQRITDNIVFTVQGGADVGASGHAVTIDGITATINKTTGTIALSGTTWTNYATTFTFVATIAGTPYTKAYIISKANHPSLLTGYLNLKYDEQVFLADAGGTLLDLPDQYGNWETFTITEECNELHLALHFPEGLRKIQTDTNRGTGAIGRTGPASVVLEYQIRQNGSADWDPTSYKTEGYSFRLPSKLLDSVYDAGVGQIPPDTSLGVFQWIRLYFAENRSIQSISGDIIGGTPELPTGLYNNSYASSYSSFYTDQPAAVILPTLPDTALPLYDICVKQVGSVVSVDRTISNITTVSHSGLALTINTVWGNEQFFETTTTTEVGKSADISAGYIVTPGNKNTRIIEFNDNKKDAFNSTIRLENLDVASYDIRIRRLTSSDPDVEVDFRNYYKTILFSVTGFAAAPVFTAPKYRADTNVTNNCLITRTALKFESSSKINGQIDGINGIVHSICRDYDSTQTGVNNQWPYRKTNNPASLFLHVLRHQANAYRVVAFDMEALQKRVDLEKLAYWHTYCANKNFTYNNVLDGSRSVLEVLRDIAAAGRASPSLVDGKWTVVIDEPRTEITQHFTPSNSWGFEASKSIPRYPHAFRVTFRDELNGYQDNEIIVYRPGYTAENSDIFEQLSLPGVTNKDAAIEHTRWNMAQATLRSEKYTINTDMEYIVCTRGDRVKVVHDVPMWGVGSARIKSINTAPYTLDGSSRPAYTVLTLDNPILLEAGTQYKIRIRTNTVTTSIDPVTGATIGSNFIEKTLVSKSVTDYYSQIVVTEAFTSLQIEGGELLLCGLTTSASHDLLVLNIEPLDNKCARITLVDYAEQIYTLDLDQFTAVYNTDITKPPTIEIEPIVVSPIVDTTQVFSDISAIAADGILNIKIPFTNAAGLSNKVDKIEVSYYITSQPTSILTKAYRLADIGTQVTIDNVLQGTNYTFKLRYIDSTGRTGPWSTEVTHTVVGRTYTTEKVTELYVTRTGTSFVIEPVVVNKSADFKHCEIRITKSNQATDFWDSNTVTYIKAIGLDSIPVDILQFPTPRIDVNGITYTVAARCVDRYGNYSQVSKLAQIVLYELEPSPEAP